MVELYDIELLIKITLFTYFSVKDVSGLDHIAPPKPPRGDLKLLLDISLSSSFRRSFAAADC